MKKTILQRIYALSILFICLLTSACGQKGDLYLPDDPSAHQHEQRILP